MTPAQFERCIATLGLSQTAASVFLDVSDRQVRRWVSGASPVPEAVSKLLRLMVRLKIKPEDV